MNNLRVSARLLMLRCLRFFFWLLNVQWLNPAAILIPTPLAYRGKAKSEHKTQLTGSASARAME